MSHATFYTLDSIGDAQLPVFVCQLTTQFMRQSQRVLLLCKDQTQAEQYDEWLWQQPAEAFVPHNLAGEGPQQGTAVLLAWLPLSQPTGHRSVVINLTGAALEQPTRYRRVIEFVPIEDDARATARDIYRIYRQQGLKLENLMAAVNVEGHHG